MKLISKRIETIQFDSHIEGNMSETLCTINYAVLTYRYEGFKAGPSIAVSKQYTTDLTADVVMVGGRRFLVDRWLTSHGDTELRVTLPKGVVPDGLSTAKPKKAPPLSVATALTPILTRLRKGEIAELEALAEITNAIDILE